MKIGNFASKYNVSIDTVRHYMNIGLIYPEKRGGWYEFDENCEFLMSKILRYKEMGFSLEEIHDLLNFQRLSLMNIKSDLDYFRNKFTTKIQSLEQEKLFIDQKIGFIHSLIERIDNYSQEIVDRKKIGIPLNALHLFQCPRCGHPFSIQSANIENNMILEGILDCQCQEKWRVKDGILIDSSSAVNVRDYTEEELDERSTIVKARYHEYTSKKFLDFLFQGIEWQRKRLVDQMQPKSVIVEVGIAHGIALGNFYDILPVDCTYIGIEHDFEKLLYAKTMIETEKNPERVIFVCSDLSNIPIKPKTADFIIDFAGTFYYHYSNNDWDISATKSTLKSNGKWIGSYLFYPKHSDLLKYDEPFRTVLDLKNIKKDFLTNQLTIFQDKIIGPVSESGQYEIFKSGLELYQYCMIAR